MTFKMIAPLWSARNLILFSAACVTAAGLCSNASAGDIPPLFNVQIEHEFPEGKAALDEVVALVLEHYYTNKVDEQSLWWGAIEGILRRLSPDENRALAAIWTPEDFGNVNQSLQGVQESIGIKSSYNAGDGSLTVTEVLEGGPSVSLLLPYDRIVRIDGEALKGLPVKEIDRLLKGEKGTRVSLKVIRDVAIFDLLIPRDRVKVENVQQQTLAGDVGYIAIRKFSTGVSDEVKAGLETLTKEKIERLVLDVRGNSGGVFNEALKCSELFIPKGKSLMRMVSHGSKINNYVSANEEAFSFRLVVLMDKHSASASEILGAALREEAGAVLVGTGTYGKATMERIYTLENKFRVKFTNAALYSPKGKSWQKTGLLPDFPASQELELAAKLRKLKPEQRLAKDGQLRLAHRVLLKMK
ncbi:MAG: PDZ domain-containing protein [Lentisphaerae bacterium]|jgi:carboxyl-terminal processing protease|nr:PDZ domain-containing protein [Lentisphaerota bacterium]MBT4817901.1 PDZ domain-containing protein [Lentisphaerota bacterium]MBT5608293.1 PDZ domain-containing protein [Lentisphaerota bacterium]MBT7061807.1 PDZ domain-containing protein [Lentisphaerota bacterium]MBT7846116.1 PDZ domain-containing protein [Lentisphaerota bacterium]